MCHVTLKTEMSLHHMNQLIFLIYSNRKQSFLIEISFPNITVLLCFLSNQCHICEHKINFPYWKKSLTFLYMHSSRRIIKYSKYYFNITLYSSSNKTCNNVRNILSYTLIFTSLNNNDIPWCMTRHLAWIIQNMANNY